LKTLLVIAHPQQNSLCRHLAQETKAHLQSRGYEITVKDLYKESFDPVLTAQERDSYYSDCFDVAEVENDIRQLQEAECLILLFPTWWFGLPAILKGWIDRIWVPGYAYLHAEDMTGIKPNLHKLKEVRVITTLGSPWWVDRFIMGRPVRKILKIGIVGACTSGCDFKMLSLYNSESLTEEKVQQFIARIKNKF